MADHIYIVLPDGDTFDGACGTDVVIIADRFAASIDGSGLHGMADLINEVGRANVLSIELDALLGDICAAATGVIPRSELDARLSILIAGIKEYLTPKETA